ncbi:MAG: crotonase/enoyl-CoA hydratase family protein [Alphaproteobacteria bacterium]|nr:crotonase/enoyl-CoA hydratase family protein [Alphaproteobacteria bacterium]
MKHERPEDDPVLVSIEGRVATVTLNEPERRNPISDMYVVEALLEVFEKLNADDGISVLVLTGAGPAFCAGGNVKAMLNREGHSAGPPVTIDSNYRRGIQRIPLALYEMEIPTICAVNGPAIGAGCDLAMMCDIRLASKKASFGETFLNLGIVPGDGGAWFLQRLVGYQRAAEMTFTGRVIDAEEALAIGLVLRLCEPDTLLEDAQEMAHVIAAKPPKTLRLTKRLMRQASYSSLADLLSLSAAYQALAHHTEDHEEALRAMFDKRTPSYTGK